VAGSAPSTDAPSIGIASILEGLDEMLTVIRIGLPDQLGARLAAPMRSRI
jgi:hypothetical protein